MVVICRHSALNRVVESLLDLIIVYALMEVHLAVYVIILCIGGLELIVLCNLIVDCMT